MIKPNEARKLTEDSIINDTEYGWGEIAKKLKEQIEKTASGGGYSIIFTSKDEDYNIKLSILRAFMYKIEEKDYFYYDDQSKSYKEYIITW